MQLRRFGSDDGSPVIVAVSGSLVMSSAAYNALGEVTTLSLGNGLQTIYQYYGLDVFSSTSSPAFTAPPQVRLQRSFTYINGISLSREHAVTTSQTRCDGHILANCRGCTAPV